MNYIDEILELARKGMGSTSPNPMVGCVIVKNGKVIGRGFHKKAGDYHAEVIALKQAGTRSKGAKLYVSLEPCCHHGKTSPCTDAIIKAGIKEVEFLMHDPNPMVSGKGKNILKKAGIKISIGGNTSEAEELNEIFAKNITTNSPFVTAKWAMSLDGKITGPNSKQMWMTTDATHNRTHLLRQQHDAILVGVNTVINDDPSLTVRLKNVKAVHPIRIIVDSAGRTPLKSKILQPSTPGRTIIATTDKMSKKKESEYKKRGAEVIRVSKGRQVNLKKLFSELWEIGITSIMIEGGSVILTSAFKNKLVDKAIVSIGPVIVGSSSALSPIQNSSFISDLKIKKVEQIENNVLITAYV